MNKPHDFKPEELSASLDGALPPARDAQLREALEESPELALQLAALARVDDALRALAASELPDAVRNGMHERLRARIAAASPAGAGGRRSPSRLRRWRPVLLAGAAAAAGLAAVLMLPRLLHSPQPLPQDRVVQQVVPEPSGNQGASQAGGFAELVDDAAPGGLDEDWDTIEVLGLLEDMDGLEAVGSG